MWCTLAIRICSKRQDELREVENLLDSNRYNRRADGDYMLHPKNDNNRGEAAVKFRWLKALLELRKTLLSLEKGGRAESFISDKSLCSVALMTRSNVYVSATSARNTDARPVPLPPDDIKVQSVTVLKRKA